MFQFLHAADLHLDSALQGLTARANAPVDVLRGASRRALDNLVALALHEQVDFVVIAGDIYDGDWKDYGTGLFFRSRMARLGQAGIPVYLIAGNHDAASVISRKLSLPDSVYRFSSRAPETLEPAGLPVAIHGMSFPQRAVEENLVPQYPPAVAGTFNLGLLHTSLAGSELHDTYAPCSAKELAEKGYAYWALGHIHQPTIVQEDPWIVYSGNLQGRHVREHGARGCRRVTVDDALEVTECAWHSLDVARWAIRNVDVDGVESLEEVFTRGRDAIGDALSEAEDRMLALRLCLVGATPLHGQLCNRPDRFEAEMEGLVGELGENTVWIERVMVSTRPVVGLEDLARRDPLTRVVVDALHERDGGEADLPPEVMEMLKHLPHDVRDTLEREWTGTGRQALLEDACSIVLERLSGKGGPV